MTLMIIDTEMFSYRECTAKCYINAFTKLLMVKSDTLFKAGENSMSFKNC